MGPLKPENILSREGGIANLELADIVDVPALQSLMEACHKILPIPLAIVDLKGKVLVNVGWQDVCTKFHRVNPETCRHCVESDTRLSSGVAPGEFKLYKCKNHLWDVATPLMVGGRHVGNLFSGQFLLADEPLDYALFREQARNYGFDEERYIAALDRVPRLSREFVQSSMSFFAQLAQMISQLSYSNVELARLAAEREQREQHLRRLGRTLQALSSSGQAMMRARSESEYLEEVCHIVVEDCGHAMVWVGFAEQDEHKTVRPVAYAGFDEGYLESLNVSWADTERGRGPTGTAIRTGRPVICRNMLTDPNYAPWREHALKHGYASAVALPLLARGQAFGALTIYSKEPDAFSPDDVNLLVELAGDLSYGISAIRAARALRESREDLNRAQAVAQTGSWRLNVHRNELLWSDETHRIFGIPKGTLLNYETFLNAVHPEDRERVDSHWQAALRGEPYDLEHRIVVGRDTKWVRERAELEFDAQGSPLGGFGTVQDITARKGFEEALAAAKIDAERAKAAAEEASRAKDHFLAVLSHELRTPLTPVLATITMLQNDPQVSADARECLALARRNIEMEARLIDDLLDVNRITRGKIELDRRPVALGEVIRRAIEVCRPEIESRELHCEDNLGPVADRLINADAVRLQQVFWNLLKNAIKFTPQGGRVQVRCLPEGDGRVVAEVVDNGEGMDPQALARVFNAFEQGSAGVTRQFGGLGLGLTISKALVEMHGGTIEAHSAGRGKGATFRVKLPVAGSQRPVAQPSGSSLATGDRKLEARALRILLVEDHTDTARIMTRLLTLKRCEVQAAGTMDRALALVARDSFDVIISDIGLPDGTGFELMRQLRARGCRKPAIAVSGYGQEDDVRRSREAGFNAHLTKPVDVEHFYRVLSAVAESGEV